MTKDNSKAFRFLCIGVDSKTIADLLTATNHLQLSLDTCRTIHDSKRFLQNHFDLYLIELEVLNDSFLNFIHEIRQKERTKSLIAVILDKALIPSEKKDIDYFIQKPSSPEQMDTLLKDLYHRHEYPQSSSASHLDELKKNYDSTIPQKIEHLKELVKLSQENSAESHLLELKNNIHKIGGSAGSFGYLKVSTLCKEMDVEISRRLALKAVDQAWLSSLDDFLEQISTFFKATSTNEMSMTIEKNVIYIVDDDKKFLELLERTKELFAIQLLIETNPQAAINQLNSSKFSPQAVVVSQAFQGSLITGLDIVDVVGNNLNLQSTSFAISTYEDNLDFRLQSMQKGVKHVFHKPISPYLFLRTLTELIESRASIPIKVLILDDDQDFCRFVVATLSETNINVHCINDPADLLTTLDEYRPNILLLDLVLPKYDGINLLKTLRQDISFRNLIIVIVTSSDESVTRLSAYSSNADDILYKPIDGSLLQKRILNLAARQESLNIPQNFCNFTGLLNIKDLTAVFEEYSIKNEFQDKYFALFEINNFDDWTMQKGYAAAKDLLISISNRLQLEANNLIKCFSYETAKFALIFNGENLNSLNAKLYNILSSIASKEQDSQLSFNCCIMPMSKSFGNAKTLLKAAEEGVKEANKKESGPVKIIDFLPKGEEKAKKEIVIIDPDSDLLRILKHAFEAHGITVHTYTEGKPALNKLLEWNSNAPSLVIIERKLPDMDGIDLLIKLKNSFRKNIPFYILTVFSSDKDISEGIKEGALEYIVKPFNISILVQKSLQVLYRNS